MSRESIQALRDRYDKSMDDLELKLQIQDLEIIEDIQTFVAELEFRLVRIRNLVIESEVAK